MGAQARAGTRLHFALQLREEMEVLARRYGREGEALVQRFMTAQTLAATDPRWTRQEAWEAAGRLLPDTQTGGTDEHGD